MLTISGRFITNNLRHKKCVRLEMSIDTYLEVQSKQTTQKKKNLITILRTQLATSYELRLLKIT